MSVTIHVPQPFSKTRYLGSLEHPGRPSRSIAGGWIADFVALNRAIMLCPFCVHKFNPRQNRYEVWRRDLYSIAKCDDCKQQSRQIRTFIPESLHFQVGDTERKPRGRWAYFTIRSRR